MKNTSKILNQIMFYVLIFTMGMLGFTTAVLLQAVTELPNDTETSDEDKSWIIVMISVVLGMIMFVGYTIPQEIKRVLTVITKGD